MELDSYFRGLLKNIEPSSTAVSHAQNAHTNLRKNIQNDEELKYANPDTFLTGSYARQTAIKDIKDVDVILLIDIDISITPPERVLAWIHQILQKYYKEIRVQGRSIGIVTQSGFELDVVPATPVISVEGPLWIPDREVHSWVKTNPKGQINYGIERNKITNGKYKHYVKILKHWKDRISSESARPSSYIIESLVAHNLSNSSTNYGRGVVQIFNTTYDFLKQYKDSGTVPKIPDPGYPEVNVAKRWKYNEFSLFVDTLETSLSISKKALAEPDIRKSISLWRQLFGDEFEEI